MFAARGGENGSFNPYIEERCMGMVGEGEQVCEVRRLSLIPAVPEDILTHFDTPL